MRRLSNKAIIEKSLWTIISTVLVIVWFGFSFLGDGGVVEGSDLSTGWAIFGIIVVLLLILGYTILWVKLFRYEVAPNEFKKEYGVISKSYTSIPYQRIQNVDIKRSLLQRMLGISSVKIQTAGSELSKAEGRIPGIDKQLAEEVREEILSKSRTDRQAGEGAQEVPNPGI
jgi:uncharacterized membrane protein YdbT with pleckstrin-like domain